MSRGIFHPLLGGLVLFDIWMLLAILLNKGLELDVLLLQVVILYRKGLLLLFTTVKLKSSFLDPLFERSDLLTNLSGYVGVRSS